MANHPNYELFEELGSGENSVVFRAWDLALSRDVAIKELKSEPGSDGGQADAKRIKQFLKEASFLAQFEHENVLRIHTVDQNRGWIVMELMKGSLASQIESEPMPADTVRSVLRQMLGALSFLHQKDKVHGAVRPSNILINEHGTVKLSDFEASSLDGELPVPKGSKKYLAPELIRSDFGSFGPAVDLYCLGFTALELLTGKKFDSLFPGTGDGAINADVAWLRWHSSDEPMKSVKQIAAKVPDDLARVIDQLLKKSVEDRPQSAAKVLKLLDDAPLVPVKVPVQVSPASKKENVKAILPTNAVKLRDSNTKKKVTRDSKNKNTKPVGKKTLNDKLGKPYVLWPICAAILATAFFVGLHLKGKGKEVAEVEPPAKPDPVKVIDDETKTEPIEKPKAEPESFLVNFNVLPDSENAKLLVGGQAREIGELELPIGKHEIVIEKDGFKTFESSISIDEDHTTFDITLEKMIVKKEPEKIVAPRFTLPPTLVAKDDASVDSDTGLPERAFAVATRASRMEFALVKPGIYRFGVPGDKRRTWELPDRKVEIENPFYIAVQEVSKSQYAEFQNKDQSLANNALPMVDVSIRDAAEFCDWLGGRLPTEQEWEAAVRGQSDIGYPLPWGSKIVDASHCNLFRGQANDEVKPSPVSSHSSSANEIGLINTIGNVAEWCDNQISSEEFVVKGCSYRIPPGDHVRVTWRNRARHEGAVDIGMRAVVPVVKEAIASQALTFAAPTNISSILVSANSDEDESVTKTAVYTKTVKEIADEFTSPAELVIDSGGFMDEITDLSFSPDGRQVAVAGGKLVRIWNVENGQLIETLRGDMSRTSYGSVNAVAWSPDGKHLLSGVNDYREHGNIRVYETSNFDEVKEVIAGHTAPCRKLCFSRGGNQLVSVDSDGMVIVRDWNSRKIVHRIPARDRDQPIYDVMKFATDKPVLIGVDFEGPQIYSSTTAKKLGARDEMPLAVRGWLIDVFNKLVPYPYGVKIPPRVMDFRMEEGRWAGAGNATVSGRSRFWVRVWESRNPVTTQTPAKEIAAYDKHTWKVTSISLQPNGPLVASGDKFGEVHIWDSTTGQLKFKFAGQGKPIYEVAFDEGSSRLAFGTTPYRPGVWGRNNHGKATRVLDLKMRAIADAVSRKDLSLINEQPSIGQSTIDVRKEDAYFYVQRKNGQQLESKYRISSGRNPTVFTLLDAPKLDVEQPVIFGDNEGLLALWDSSRDELKRAFIGHGNLVSGVSASPNGRLIASSSTDRTIRLWSLDDHVPTGIFDFKFENSAVREVVAGSSSAKAGVQVGDKIVSIDGKSLTEMFELMLMGKFEYKPDQIVPVTMKRQEEEFTYQMKMGDGYDFVEPILNFYMGDDGQWIIWHPQGYYDASPGADQLIGWHINRGHDKSAKFFEVQQFREKLYRPDVIDGILETGSLKDALAKLRAKPQGKEEIDFREPEAIAEHYPPSVRIISPTDSWQTESQQVTVTGEATSVNGLPITALTLLHNGNVAKVFRPTKVNQLKMEIAYDMQLSAGQNDLVLIAANSKSTSQGEHIVVSRNQSMQKNFPDAIVLAIGVSEFNEALGSLPQSANDATIFAKSMKSHQNGRLYGNVKSKLIAGNVEDDAIMDGFQWLADNTKEGDVAIVFVASHAVIDRRDNFYIATSNTTASKARSTAVSWRDLMDTLQLDLPDCKRMVFLDLQPTEGSIKPGLRNPLLDLASPEMGTIFLSANTLQQRSASIGSAGTSPFMKAVLETVSDRKFDTNPGDSLFNPVELAAGVSNRVKFITKDQQQTVFFTPEFAKLANVLELQN